MTEREYNIVSGVLVPDKPECAKFAYDGGYFYGTDMFRMVRLETDVYPLILNGKLPVFEDNEKHPDYKRYMIQAAESNYTKLEIPYTPDQIREWEESNDQKIPFKLGIKQGWIYIGLQPSFLADAMETCQTNEVYVPDKLRVPLLISGNGFTWLVMPVMLQGYNRDKVMTKI